MGTAFSEPTLIKLASGFEAATHVRLKPQFLTALPLDGQPHRRRREHEDGDSISVDRPSVRHI